VGAFYIISTLTGRISAFKSVGLFNPIRGLARLPREKK